MASRPVVLCYSSFTPPKPAQNLLLELARAYEGDFTLLDQKVVTDLSEDERAKIEGIVCTGGYTRTDHKLGQEIMDLLPNLKVISTPSMGLNHIDVQAATDRGVRIGRSLHQIDAVAEFAFGLLLASARSIVLANEVARTTVFSSGQVSKKEIIYFEYGESYLPSQEFRWMAGRVAVSSFSVTWLLHLLYCQERIKDLIYEFLRLNRIP